MSADQKNRETSIHREVTAAREGRHPRLVARLASGWLVFGERQVVTGYVLLLPDPVVPTLNALAPAARSQFLMDMSFAGDVLLRLTDAARINYAILGNQDPALHAHVFPRYTHEPEPMRTSHPWSYDWNQAPLFDRERHRGLLEALQRELANRSEPRIQ